jgi:two-component system response regulator YesN
MTAKVSAYLQDNLSRSVSLAEIAEHLHVSVSSLTHRYREEVGETPMETRMRLAVTAAKTLLLKGWPLKHIAERTGFCDEYHLSKTFKKLEKTSPRAWLQSFSGIPFREKYF